MGYDPRERDFRRDFYQDDISGVAQAPRTTAVKNETRSNRRSIGETITELKFRLSEATEHMGLMNRELAAAKRLARYLEDDAWLTQVANDDQQKDNIGRCKKKRQTVVCKRCETTGHHWLDCQRVSCSCGGWNSRAYLPGPTCVRGTIWCRNGASPGEPLSTAAGPPMANSVDPVSTENQEAVDVQAEGQHVSTCN